MVEVLRYDNDTDEIAAQVSVPVRAVLSCSYSLVEKSVGKASKRQNRFAPFTISLISLHIKETSKKDLGGEKSVRTRWFKNISTASSSHLPQNAS